MVWNGQPHQPSEMSGTLLREHPIIEELTGHVCTENLEYRRKGRAVSDNNPAEQNPYQSGLTPPPAPQGYPGYPPVPPTSDAAVAAAAAAHGYAPPPNTPDAYPVTPYATAQYQQPAQYNQAVQYAQPAQYGQPYGYAPARPSSGLALTSLITGIAAIVLIWITVGAVAAIVAVVTGHMALNRMKSQPELTGRGMAITGLVLGYVTLGIGAIFALFFMLVFGSMLAWR